MLLESQYHFATISVTKAWMFMKFETEAYEVVIDYQKTFHENSVMHIWIRS